MKSQALALLALSAICNLAMPQESTTPQMPVPLEEQLNDFRQLRRNKAEVRLCVARLHAIGSLGTDQAVDALIELVPQLRGGQQMAAVHAISLANSNYANELLRILAHMRRADDVRRQACRDLMLLGGEHHLFLRDQRLVREKNLMIRGEVLRGLIEHGVPHLEDEVLRAAKSKDSIYASAGIYGVGVLQLTRGRKFVEAAALSDDLQLRRDAFQALGALGGARSFSLLMDAYADDRNLMFREQLAAALQRADDADEVEVMISDGLDSKQVELVRIATNVISFAAPRFPQLCNPSLFELLDHADTQVRDVALGGLVHAPSKDVADTLFTRLTSEDAQTCCDALWALNKLDALPADSEQRVIELTSHSNTAVRIQAAAALSRFQQSDSAVAAALQLLQDTSWVVRSAAVESLVLLRQRRALPGLLALIGREHGRLRNDAVHAMAQLTGENFGLQTSAWESWLDDRPSDYQLPSLKEAQKTLQAHRTSRDHSGHSVVQNSYFGLEVPPGGVVFVLDISESMAQPFDNQKSFYQHFSTALSATLAKLPAETKFNVVLFSSGVKIWNDELRLASTDNISSAQSFLSRAYPGGGTNLFDALLASFTFADTQTIFLLTDGAPTLGRITAPEGLLRELERWNRNRRIRLHTIAAGAVGADFLAELAAANGGKAVDLVTTMHE